MLIEIHSHYCYIACIIIIVYVGYGFLSIPWNCQTLPATVVNSQSPEANKSANSGGLSDSASILDIIRWHQWNNLGACADIKFFGGHIWQASSTHRDIMDGHKALCFDKNVRPVPGNCLIYSFGINSDWSYDTDLAEYGCEVHSFDPSIEEPPQIGRNKFYFHKIGLDGRDYINPKGWQMMTLKSIMKFLGHENRVVDAVKMDIEESEYEAVPNMVLTGVLEKIKQMAIETHNFSMEEKDRKRFIEKFRRILKLEKFGFIRFSSQPAMNTNLVNHIAKMSDFFCYEIAWYNPKFYK